MGAFAMLNVKSSELLSSTNNEIENKMKEKTAIIHVKNVTAFALAIVSLTMGHNIHNNPLVA